MNKKVKRVLIFARNIYLWIYLISFLGTCSERHAPVTDPKPFSVFFILNTVAFALYLIWKATGSEKDGN